MIRRTVGVVAALAAFGAAGIPAAVSAGPPAKRCPTAHALVAYYVSDGWTSEDVLVIRRDGQASLCWERRTLGPTDQLLSRRSGRSVFVVSRSKMSAVVRQLVRIGVDRLGAPPPPLQLRWLVYHGKRVPIDGSPRTNAGKRALRRAEAILDGVIAPHAPH